MAVPMECQPYQSRAPLCCLHRATGRRLPLACTLLNHCYLRWSYPECLSPHSTHTQPPWRRCPGGRRRRRRGCIAPSPGKISFCWTCLERPGGRKPQGRRYLQDYGYELRNEQYKIKPYSLTVYIQSLSQWKVFIDKNSVGILRSHSIPMWCKFSCPQSHHSWLVSVRCWRT